MHYGRTQDQPFSSVSTEQLPPRIVLMGASRVGTTSLLRRFTMGLYVDDYRTEQAKVMRHTRSIFLNRLRDHVTVQFWDVEGNDIRTALMCAQKAHAVAVTYDMTNRNSFELAQKLLDHINPRASSILIATKSDLIKDRKVSQKEGKLLARIHRVEYLETSSKMDSNIDEVFQILVGSVPNEYLKTREGKPIGHRSSAVMCSACNRKVQTDRKEYGRKDRYNSN